MKGGRAGEGGVVGKESAIRYPEFAPADIARQVRRARPVAGLARYAMRLLTKVEVTGQEHIAPGPVIIAPYHASAIDPLIVGLAIWKQGVLPHFLAKSSLYTGLVGIVLTELGQIPVLRGSTQAGDSLLYGKRALEAGESVVIYPQGTLTKDPELWPQPAKTGAARLSIESGVPVVPVAHWGLGDVMSVGAKFPRPRPFTSARVHFGAPVTPPAPAVRAGHSGQQQTRRFADRITAAIAAELAILRATPLPERFRADLEPQEDA